MGHAFVVAPSRSAESRNDPIASKKPSKIKSKQDPDEHYQEPRPTRDTPISKIRGLQSWRSCLQPQQQQDPETTKPEELPTTPTAGWRCRVAHRLLQGLEWCNRTGLKRFMFWKQTNSTPMPMLKLVNPDRLELLNNNSSSSKSTELH
jgi:hypothetical protein